MPAARSGAAAVAYDGRVFVIGGLSADGIPLSSVLVYDPSSDSWNTATSLPSARSNAAAAVFDDRIILAGGRGADGQTLQSTLAFDATSEQWTPVGDLPDDREGLALAATSTMLFAIGGSNQGAQILNTVASYDPSGNQWQPFNAWTLQIGRASFAASVAADTVYVLGGFSTFGPTGIAEQFHGIAGPAERASLLPARGGLASASLESSVYAIGGRVGNNDVIDTVSRFIPEVNRWENVASLITAREGAAAISINNQILVFGGLDAAGNTLQSVEAYDFVTAPLAVGDTGETAEDTALQVNVLSNDSDPAGGTLQLAGFTQPQNGFVTETVDQQLLYTPALNFFGSDFFSYTVSNEKGGSALATVQITVNPVNDAPAIISAPLRSIQVNEAYAYGIDAEDVEGDPITITSSPLPAWLMLTNNGDGTASLSGTPSDTELGTFAIEIQATDGQDTTRQAFELIVINGLPAVPQLLTPEDGSAPNSDRITFTWSGENAASYQMQLALDAQFLDLVTDTTLSASELTLDGFIESEYYWRVRGINALGTSDWSVTFAINNIIAIDVEDELPAPSSILHPTYPNPFSHIATISFSLERATQYAELTIYDLNGRQIRTLITGSLPQGSHQTTWDGHDVDGRPLASGLYLIRLRTDTDLITQSIALVR